MEIRHYRESKSKGQIELRKYGQSFQIFKRQFDPDTGEEIAPAIQTITRAMIEKQRDALIESLNEHNTLLADMDATP